MILAGSIEELHLNQACLTIGSFDGVHIGHQKLIAALKASANQYPGAQVVVLTFFPHPAVVLKGIDSPFYLSTPEEKADQFNRLGVDALISIPFSAEIAGMSAGDFMQLLNKHMALKELVVGCGFTLGKNRSGNVEVLTEIGKASGFIVCCISPESTGDEIISSSMIRKMLEEGDVQAASRCLGRFYSLTGRVVEGDGRGRTIGFPTANLDVWPQKLLPASGVYRCLTLLDGQTYLSVANVGYRPTFTDNTKQVFVEIHVLDFKENLYGKKLQVQFTHRLRGEIKYASFENLVDQIHRDIQAAREI
jgi:riboflavin kinase / FMN adenylyltransferase